MDRVTKERFASDVNAVLVDAEELLRQAAQATGEEAKVLRGRAQEAIGRAKDSLVHIEQRAVAQTKAAAHATPAEKVSSLLTSVTEMSSGAIRSPITATCNTACLPNRPS